MSKSKEDIFVCHTGTDTWFSLTDTTYVIDGRTANENDEDSSIKEGYLAETARTYGYKITPDLAQKIYKLIKEYHKS